MKIIFTTNNMIGSRLIRWFTGEPVSHVAFVFDEKIVVHSSLFGIDLKWYKTFKQHSKILYSYDIPMRLVQEEAAWQDLLDCHDKVKYDYSAILYFGWRMLLKKLFKTPLPDKNKWQNPMHDMCVEVYERVRRRVPELKEIKNLSMVTPYGLWLNLIEEKRLYVVR